MAKVIVKHNNVVLGEYRIVPFPTTIQLVFNVDIVRFLRRYKRVEVSYEHELSDYTQFEIPFT